MKATKFTAICRTCRHYYETCTYKSSVRDSKDSPRNKYNVAMTNPNIEVSFCPAFALYLEGE